jgi:glutamyl-tRNA synthetase
MFEKQQTVVTRMAPSPTGHLHIGTARTALYNFLYARNKAGRFIMRSENTDAERSTKEYEEEILDGLAWLGIEWDAYYRQSERTDVYTQYLERLLRSGSAYLSKEESKREPGTMIELIRLKNPNKTITFNDQVRGEISFDTTELGNFVIARSLESALYHFAAVVDDHEMGVTHVIRGEDHISNTPRQILIGDAIGLDRPMYAHLPLILASDKSKLSKRHGAVSLYEFKDQGYLPEAMVNYLAFLGWNPGTDQEIFTLLELIEAFDLGGIQKGGAIYNVEKLKWFNREHLKKVSHGEYFKIVEARISKRVQDLPQYSDERLERLMHTIRERTGVAYEITEEAEKGEYDFAFTEPPLNVPMLKWKNDSTVRDVLPRLQKIAEILSTIDEDLSPDEIKNALWDYALRVGKGEVLWPLRVALTGKERSPDPFTVIYIIGSGEAYKRIRKACDTILSA